MNYRIWDREKKKWATTASILFTPMAGGQGVYEQGRNSLFRYNFYLISSMKDKEGRCLTEGDIVKVENAEGGMRRRFIVRFGTCYRVMDTGAPVEINGFYFELDDKLNSCHGKPYFQITENHKGCHDSALTTWLGHIEDYDYVNAPR